MGSARNRGAFLIRHLRQSSRRQTTLCAPGVLWDVLPDRRAVLEFHEDNETCIGAIKSGYSPAMRHIKRTHGVCLRWLTEPFAAPGCNLFYERSALQAADIYTKAFAVPAE